MPYGRTQLHSAVPWTEGSARARARRPSLSHSLYSSTAQRSVHSAMQRSAHRSPARRRRWPGMRPPPRPPAQGTNPPNLYLGARFAHHGAAHAVIDMKCLEGVLRGPACSVPSRAALRFKPAPLTHAARRAWRSRATSAGSPDRCASTRSSICGEQGLGMEGALTRKAWPGVNREGCMQPKASDGAPDSPSLLHALSMVLPSESESAPPSPAQPPRCKRLCDSCFPSSPIVAGLEPFPLAPQSVSCAPARLNRL